MSRMIDFDRMKRRIEAATASPFRSAHDKAIRPEASLPLYHVFAAGPVMRRKFIYDRSGERTARGLMAKLLQEGLLQSDTAAGPVRWGLPLDALQFLFPELYPEAATSPE